MNRPRFLFVLIASGIVALFTSRLAAQPLVLAGAVNKTAFVGDGNVTFSILATGTPAPTYQWQTGTPGNFANITDNATFAGSNTATLTINISDLTLNGTEYRCKVTSNSVKVNSLVGTLTVYNAPTVTPVLTVTGTGVDGSSNPTIAANSTANVTINVSGLNSGDTVRVQRFLDSNDDGKTEVYKPVVQSFVVTDGGVTKFGGITDPDIPGDDDGAADGNVTTHITIPSSPEGGQLAGSYIIKISSPTGEFEPITKELIVTQPNYGQNVSGQVTNGIVPLPYASVVLLASDNNGGSKFVGGTVADANGNYTLEAPLGSFNAIGFSLGYVQTFSDAASVTLTSGVNQIGANITLTPATCTIVSQVKDANSSTTLRGVQFFVQSNNNGQAAIVSSNPDGGLICPLTSASDWDFNISQYSTHALGFLQPQNDLTVDTTNASSSNNTLAEANITLTAANALIYGTIETTQSTPLAGVNLNADDNSFQDSATTYGNGSYFLLANGPSTTPADNWNVSPSGSNSVLAGYIPLSDVNVNVLSGNAYQENFVASAPTAFLQGTVTNNGTPVVGATVDASPQGGGNNLQATTDSNGNFSIGVSAGTYSVNLDNNSTDSDNLVTPQLSETVSTNQTLTGIALQVLSATDTVSGTVEDANDHPLSSDYNVFATATISGVQYVADANLDNNGDGGYSLPLINGSWTFTVYGPNGPASNFQPTTVAIAGSQTLNLTPPQPTAHFQGTVTNNGSPVVGAVVDARQENGNDFFQATTDSNGNFTLGVVAGTWNIFLDDSANLVSSPLNGEVIIDNQTISSLAIDVLTSTGTISGTVNDYNGNPVPNFANVFGSATVNSIIYSSNAQTDSNGHYSLPVVNGVWSVQAGGPNLNYQSQNVTVAGSATANFTASVFISAQGNETVSAGQNASFAVDVNAPNSSSDQWQVSTNGGSTWSNLTDNATYFGSATNVLTINNSNTAMNGYEYECVVSFTYNSSPVAQTSSAATLTVNPANQPPGFSISPTDQQTLTNGNVTFCVNASGYPAPTIQWQVSTDGGNTWCNLTDGSVISGSSSAMLTVTTPPITFSGYQYRAVASNSSGSPSTSGPATLVVGFSSPYLNWLGNNFDSAQLGNPAISGIIATPAGDGITNLVKYGLQLPPLSNDQDLLPQATVVNGQLSLSFNQAEGDVDFSVEVSTDLVNWNGGATTQISGVIETATYPLSNNPGPTFMRIEITPLPPGHRRIIGP